MNAQMFQLIGFLKERVAEDGFSRHYRFIEDRTMKVWQVLVPSYVPLPEARNVRLSGRELSSGDFWVYDAATVEDSLVNG